MFLFSHPFTLTNDLCVNDQSFHHSLKKKVYVKIAVILLYTTLNYTVTVLCSINKVVEEKKLKNCFCNNKTCLFLKL